MVNEESFNAIVVSKEDFSGNFDLSKDELNYVWEFAKSGKLEDLLMQDFDLCMNACVDIALENYAKDLQKNGESRNCLKTSLE